MKYSAVAAVAAGAVAVGLPSAYAFIAPTRLPVVGRSSGHVCGSKSRLLTRVGSIQLPTRPEEGFLNGQEQDQQPSVAPFAEGAAPAEPGAVVERRAKGSPPPPKVVIEGDMLEGTWQQRLIVGGGFTLSALALAQAFSGVSMSDPSTLAGVVATTAFAVVFSDFFSGLFHWSVDNYGDRQTPVMGEVIAAFQGHHDAPWTITYRPFENNVHKISGLTILPILGIMLGHAPPLAALFGVLFFNLQVLSQEFHKLSHLSKPPQWAQVLQDAGLIISRKEHGQHHSSPFEGNYCILTGMCNSFLDSTGFFRRLEVLVYKLTGAEPNCWKLGPEVKQAALSMQTQ